MSHHHRIIVPAITDRPTCAGPWEWTPDGIDPALYHVAVSFERRLFFGEKAPGHIVLVTETPGAGRICRELRMGGHALCGLAPWSGKWRKA